MKTGMRAVALGLILSLLLSFCGFFGNCEDIHGRVLRLHLLAHSDDEVDQQVKLAVRDALVEETAGLFDRSLSADEAASVAEREADAIAVVANRVLREQGMAYTAAVRVTDAWFPTRTYGTVTLPAGVYRAVQVTLGSGAGHNWWCVVYPPLCLSAASGQKVADVLTGAETEIVTNRARFRVGLLIVEWAKKAARFFGKASSKNR